MGKFTVGSLFSGCGGFDYGFKQAGFDIKWANDINSDACLTYKRNIGEILEKSIYDLKDSELPPVDIITAGFPCQPFSNAGSRKGIKDDKGSLVNETYKIIERLRPKVVVYENVRGLLSIKGKRGKLIDEIQEELGLIGYRSSYKLLNFSHFGVPQNRLRVVMIAVQDDFDIDLLFPEIEPYKDLSIEKTLSSVTSDLPNQNELMKLNPQALHYGKMIPEGGSWKSLEYDVLPERWKKIRDNMARYHYPNFFRRYHRTDIMGTITAAFKPENAAVWHSIEGRIYTVREIATFQTFPADFVFYGKSIKSKYQQIGNAVPPLFMEKLGRRLKKYLLKDFDSLVRDYPDSSSFNVNQPLYKQLDKINEEVLT